MEKNGLDQGLWGEMAIVNPEAEKASQCSLTFNLASSDSISTKFQAQIQKDKFVEIAVKSTFDLQNNKG